MIVRIVKMTFLSDKTQDFLTLFHASKEYIRAMPGCTHLELLNDIHSPDIFFTYSYWQSEEDLNNYRDSELFKKVWGATKLLHAKKAEAWSLKLMANV